MRQPSSRRVISVVIGLVIAAAGAAAVFFEARNLSPSSGNDQQANQTIQVVIAKRAIQPGTQIVVDDLTAELLPASQVSSNTFNTEAQAVGQYALVKIGPKDIVTKGMVAAAPGTDVSGGVFELASGYVAIAIPDDVVPGVGGYIEPGSHIDIIIDGISGGGSAFSIYDVTVLRVASQGHTGDPDLLVLQATRSQATKISDIIDRHLADKPTVNFRFVLRAADSYGKPPQNS